MIKKTKAQQLADWLDGGFSRLEREAAVELRRLSAEEMQKQSISLKLAEEYARAEAAKHIEMVYGTNKSYTAEKVKEAKEALEMLSAKLLRLEAEVQALRGAVPADYVLVPKSLIDEFPEINPSNYDHDDACALNSWGCEVVTTAIAAAPQPAQGEKQ